MSPRHSPFANRSQAIQAKTMQHGFSRQASLLDRATNCQQLTSITLPGVSSTGRIANDQEFGRTSPSCSEGATTSPCRDHGPSDQQAASASPSQPECSDPVANLENAASRQQAACKTAPHSEPTPAFSPGPAANDEQAARDAPPATHPPGSSAPSSAFNAAESVRTSQLRHLSAEQEAPALSSPRTDDTSTTITTEGMQSQDQAPEMAESETESAQERRHINRRREKAPMPRTDPQMPGASRDPQPHLGELSWSSHTFKGAADSSTKMSTAKCSQLLKLI
ncbi:hypothetical protein EJ03DRAFT_213948 [Teratosphaeria nubilosa]|uniref:Uncharacterized protein n=1 Tax=Teratosphaeria nubilosa TaxID=161662 RepID=A0A6G1LHU4_9PEZI|nr:hypothetical protein EJ03DRAFT_213948 [Teratosphaeria nubilosa]